MSKKAKLIVFTAMIVVIAIIMQEPPKKSDGSYGEAQVGGAFALTDQTGRRISNEDLKGKFSLIFLGYSNCPDICPATLAVISDTLKKLGSDADKLNAVFISVDSKNDTPEKLSEYLKNFDPRIIALTGSDTEVKAILSSFKAYAKQSENAAPGNNLISHSGFVYLMDEHGKYIRHFDNAVKSDALVEAVKVAFPIP